MGSSTTPPKKHFLQAQNLVHDFIEPKVGNLTEIHTMEVGNSCPQFYSKSSYFGILDHIVFDFIEHKPTTFHIESRFYRDHLGTLYKMEAHEFPMETAGGLYKYIYIYHPFLFPYYCHNLIFHHHFSHILATFSTYSSLICSSLEILPNLSVEVSAGFTRTSRQGPLTGHMKQMPRRTTTPTSVPCDKDH